MRILGCGFLIALMLSTVSCGAGLYHLVTKSPGRIYGIRISETKNVISSENIWTFKVFLDLAKDGRPIVTQDLIYVSDEGDLRFGDIAPNSEWISEKALRLGDNKNSVTEKYDLIEFSNNSGRTITNVLISGKTSKRGEKLLLLDIKPGEKVRVQTAAQTDEGADLSWLQCIGRFEDGKTLNTVGRNFYIKGKYKSPSHYFITVADNTAEIESQEYQAVK